MIGCEMRRLQEDHTDARIVYGAFHGDELIAKAAHLTDDLALQILVRQVYAFHSLEALKWHGWQCARYRRIHRLQIHHRRYRSHGGITESRTRSRYVGTATS
jgi:hypothetical protein